MRSFTSFTQHKPHGFIPLLLLMLIFFLLSAVEAQQPPPPPSDQYPIARFSPSMAIIIVILIAALFFMGFFSIYIRHCSDSTTAAGTIRQTLSMRRRGAGAARGLDASVLETFPTFTYAEVKDHKIGKGALECAVCLNEFEDNETIRLIPKCDHVFHPECIDAWLESHVTCPVCRADLAAVPETAPAEAPPSESRINEQSRNDEVSIQVECDESIVGEEGENARPEAANRTLRHSGSVNRPPRSWSVRRPRMFSKFRSHSTGHSLVLPGENLDRFTLRLPEELRREMVNRARLNRTGSCAARFPREGSTRRGYRTGGGEGSSKGVRFSQRIDVSDRATKSDRWAFFTRALSMKSPRVADNGESSTSKSQKTVVKMPSFKCLEPKSSDEIGLVRSDSARPPV